MRWSYLPVPVSRSPSLSSLRAARGAHCQPGTVRKVKTDDMSQTYPAPERAGCWYVLVLFQALGSGLARAGLRGGVSS